MNAKRLLKYFLAGCLGGGIVSFVLGYTPFLSYLYLPYISLIFSIPMGITTLIAGIILEFILKE